MEDANALHHEIYNQHQYVAVDPGNNRLQAAGQELQSVSIVLYPHAVGLNTAALCSRSVEDFSYRKCINRLLRDDWDASLPRLLQFRSWVTRIVAAPEAGPQEVTV